MPDFNEQLRTISGLREKCRQCDERLYRTRVELQRTNQRLRRAEQRQTIVDPDRDRQTADLRRRMSQLDARLALLREEMRKTEQWFAQLSEQRRLIQHLEHSLLTIQTRIAALRHDIAELRQQVPPLVNEIELRQAELAGLEQLIAELRLSLEQAGELLHGLEGQEQAKRRKQDELRAAMEGLRDELRATQGRLSELLLPVFDDNQDVNSRRKEIEAAAERIKGDCNDCSGTLNTAIGGLYGENPHPKNALRGLDDRTPFLLFPVRLETIFVPLQSADGLAGTELWVRVYPDEIAIHTHETTLTDREVVAGELYWTELVTAEHLRAEQANRRGAAWRHLVELFGGQRASWVVRQTKPSDWDSLATAGAAQTLPDFLRLADAGFFDALRALALSAEARAALEESLAKNDGDAFVRLAEKEEWFDRLNALARTRINGFPVHDLTKTDAWSRAPRTHVMPDRFVLLLYKSDTASPREISGNIIPDTLFLGPDPLDSAAGFVTQDNALVFGSAFDWMSDFDRAVAQGMGFRVPLTNEEARDGFAKVLVLGLFLSANENDSAALLEELIDNHQFSPKGFSIVPQGTPTNNTERNGTGYSDNDPYDDLAFFTATDPPAFNPLDPDARRSQTDGRLLADALGISYAPLLTVLHADQTDLLEAYAMSTALFPCTLGYWLRSWMAPVVTEQIATQTRQFFTRFVTGRGPLPAVRVGNQPYGVLLTSDFSRWKYPEPGNEFVRVEIFADQISFFKQLYQLLSKLEQVWTNLAAKLLFVGKPGSDSGDVLLNILGLHPTSVEFFQRVGYSDEYLRNADNFKTGKRYVNELDSLIFSMPATARLYLRALGIERGIGTVGEMQSLHVLWQHYVTSLDAPNLVENKPPSETRKLTFNYIDWLAQADSAQKIISQDFSATPPSALLYLMLRNAVLLQLHHGSYAWLKERTDFDSTLQQSLVATTLRGMRDSAPTVSQVELMTTHVGVAEPAHPAPLTSIADVIWLEPAPAETEASFLKAQKTALLNLSDTPTARLERCFVEHLDCCNYRLDAWQTGLFTQRLRAQRRSDGEPGDRRLGIYLGAFGWVEPLVPARKTFLRKEDLPPSLQPNDSHPVLEEDEVIPPGGNVPPGARQGGFVHAPSLSHAAAAALLRNAYLSHAKPDQAEMFTVNLSSERVRRAEFILEGMRNGQPIEALLGYQFERGLHDRTSESAARGDVPVIELNEFILPYRQAFPFESREVVQTGTGAAAETVPPFSVINGLSLAQAALSAANGFGLSTVLSSAEQPGTAQGNAILLEHNALLDTLDAVKDLLMAENAFQLVRGNFDRVAAVSLAQKDAHIPPELEVINTPRGTDFTFTNRVTLHFDDLDPALPANNPWPDIPLTPRANAETGMNHWLGPILGNAPDKIRCDAYWVEKAADGSDLEHDRHSVTLRDLRIQPVDFVWMTGINLEDTGGATELETRIAWHYRRAHSIGDDKTVRIEFNPAVAVGELAFARLFPLARQVRFLLSESRALNAEDFLPAAGGKATAVPVDENNVKGYDAPELRSRVQSTLNALVALADAIGGPAAPQVELVFINDPDKPADDETFVGLLGDAFNKLESAKLTFTDVKRVSVSFPIVPAETLHQKLQAIANFGIADAFPPESDLTNDGARAALLARAHLVARRLRGTNTKNGILDRATAALSKSTPDKSIEDQVATLLEAGKILFGETFNWLPKFSCHNEIDLATADAGRGQLLKHAVAATLGLTAAEVVEEWQQGLARVRPKLYRWEVLRTLVDALHDLTLALRPVQVPFRANDSWLAVEFPEKDPNFPDKPFGVSRDTLSIAAHGASAFQAGTRQSGVLLDDWTEEIPTDQEITGIAFRFNQPNAAPPQTLLLVVTPEETGSWDWDDLVGALSDTLRRAKHRAVEPEQLEKEGSVWNAFAPALVSEFSTLERADVSLDLMGMLNFSPLDQFYATLALTR